MLFPLNRGVRIADFHSEGILPVAIQSLKSLVIVYIKLAEYCFNTFVATPETPGLLWLARESIVFWTIISVVFENLKEVGVIWFELIKCDRWFDENSIHSSKWAVDSDKSVEKKPLNKLLISAGLLAVEFPFTIEEECNCN